MSRAAMSTSTAPTRNNEGREVDRNGFYLSADQLEHGLDASGVPLVLEGQALKLMRRREDKWREMISNWDFWMSKHPMKVKQRCRKGIPNSIRGRAWQMLCGADVLCSNNRGKYEELVAEADRLPSDHPLQQYLEIIDRDLDRTFPHNERFSIVGGEGQKELRDVLRAYAVYNEELGYCQGMGMVAGTLLMQMPTEQAFWCIVSMCDKYVKGFFDAGLSEVQICATVLQSLLRTELPKLHAHLEKEGMEPLLYFTDWFMCVYVKTLPWASVLRVWDMFFFEGMKVLFRVALCIMKLSEHELLTNCPSIGELMTYLRDLPPEMLTPAVLIPNVLKVDLKRAEIEALHAKAAQVYLEKHPPKPKASEPSVPVSSSTSSARTTSITAGSDPVDGAPTASPRLNGGGETVLAETAATEGATTDSTVAVKSVNSNGNTEANTVDTAGVSLNAAADHVPLTIPSSEGDNPFSGSSDEEHSSDDEHPVVTAEPSTLTERFVVDMDEV
eukprot:m.252170 g.252170  ORF g.252170 m.252170 type:complete len:500 (+) comp19557_c0_seq3:192-1691(+)